ncbi:enoyl-CoA hydratase/isomerase family protein [bacterium]|nr:enoyl-CoA hydratase/isomerase family protein [bacterium]
MQEVLFSKSSAGVGTLTLSAPEALNAMDEGMAKLFQSRVEELRQEALRALIVTGAGKAFSAGGNLEMLEAKTKLSPEENKRRMLQFYDSFLCIRELGVPLVAAVNGHAIGAGLCLALACDIRVVSREAKLGMTFTKLGLHPGMGGTWFVPQVLGRAAAFELLVTGRVLRGEDVVRFGISRELVAPDEVLPKAEQITQEIVGCGPLATRQLVETLRNPAQDLAGALEREATCQGENYASDDFREGIRAIQEKRAPKFGKENSQ